MLRTFKCKRCSHEWATRKKEGKPQTCPKCRSHVWDKVKQVTA